MASLPYNPTTLLLSPKHDDIVYALDAPSNENVRLRALNISSSVSASSISFDEVTPGVPFGSSGTSYTAFISLNGTIYSLAGKCSDGASGATAWTFTPDENDMNGDWAQGLVTVQESGNTTIGGANYLAGGVAFSSNLNATADMYVFGGMCPDSSASGGNGQSDASYSNTLLHLQPAKASGASSYSLETVTSRGPPIPEAGFTFTALSPTYFNATTGNVTIQQNFVLLGGHTQTAFINMSQVAILSLPQQTWAFIPIDQPQGLPGSDPIDPRSGHTAVLSEDGQQIVVLGGWVGDPNTPADPQLAILEIGEGFGGDGDWQWNLTKTSGTGPETKGIYGHGAVMLPGNVLMVSGGFEIGSSQGELARRATPDTYFFNVTAKEWISEYKNPHQYLSENTEAGPDKAKVGLGAGLGVGLSVLIAVLVAFFWCRRKKRRERKIHENDLRALALGNDQLHSPILGFGGIDGRGGDFNAGQWTHHPAEDGANAYSWAPPLRTATATGQSRPNDAERTGLLVEIPSPTRGLRRSLHSRGSYWHEDGRRSRGSSYIHPIDERDEDEQASRNGLTEMVKISNAPVIPPPSQRRLSDPFRDPPEPRSLLDGSRSPSPQLLPPGPNVATFNTMSSEVDRPDIVEKSDWESEPFNEIDHLTVGKTERTSSSLSNRSMVSALSQQPASSVGDSIVGRTQSQRSTMLFSTRQAPIASNCTPGNAVEDWNARSQKRMSAPPAFAQIKRRPVPSSLSSHPTARKSIALQPGSSPSSFQQLQAEGAILLRNSPHGPTFPKPGYVAAAVAAIDSDDNDFDAEPLSRRKPSQSRPQSWMGSVRRAIVGSASAASYSNRSSATPSPIGRSAGSSPRRAEFPVHVLDNLANGNLDSAAASNRGNLQRSTSADPTEPPWGRRQQGARAWADDQQRSNTFTSDTGPIGDWGGPASQTVALAVPPPSTSTGESEGEEWDVESAVERRVVQLMFTVPKEKLRVVNRGVGDADVASLKSQLSRLSRKSNNEDARYLEQTENVLVESHPEAGGILDPAAVTAEGSLIRAVPEDTARATREVGERKALDEEEENYVIHDVTDDEAEDGSHGMNPFEPTLRVGGSYTALESDEEDANFVVHAQTDDEDDEPARGSGSRQGSEQRDTTPVPRALAWRKQRDAAIERLRQTSGEAAVERVRKGSGESSRIG